MMCTGPSHLQTFQIHNHSNNSIQNEKIELTTFYGFDFNLRIPTLFELQYESQILPTFLARKWINVVYWCMQERVELTESHYFLFFRNFTFLELVKWSQNLMCHNPMSYILNVSFQDPSK